MGCACLVVVVWGVCTPNAIPHCVMPLSVQKHTAMHYLRLICTVMYTLTVECTRQPIQIRPRAIHNGHRQNFRHLITMQSPNPRLQTPKQVSPRLQNHQKLLCRLNFPIPMKMRTYGSDDVDARNQTLSKESLSDFFCFSFA